LYRRNHGGTIHVSRGGDDAIEFRNYDGRVGPDAPIDACAVCRDVTHLSAAIRQLSEAAWCDSHGIVLHLKRRQYVAVGEAQETVRMHHPGDVAELPIEARVRWIACVEYETLAGAETIGEEPGVRGHFVLGVMGSVVAARDGDGSYKSTVAT